LTGILSDQSLARLRWLASLIFVALFGYYIADTLHWPMVWDTPVMHYIIFLMKHGLHPYTQITDMNLPGCYLTEGWGMAIFGWSDLAWRFYEYFLLTVLTLAGVVIGGKRNWFAGIFAATFFIVMHGSEGPFFSTERDELMTVLLVAAVAFVFVALRRRLPLLLFPASLLAGLSTSLKPGALVLEVLLLVVCCITLYRRGERFLSYVGWAVLGNVLIGALMLWFMLHAHALGHFLFIVRHVLPSYSGLQYKGMGYLVRHLMPASLAPLLVLGLLVAVMRRQSIDWERTILVLAALVGALSFFAQKKGYLYHRYQFIVFLLLWIGWEFSEAMQRQEKRFRVLALAGVATLFLAIVPYYVLLMHKDSKSGVAPDRLATALQKDLIQLGGDHLQRQVQCMDLINGCLDALYELRLVQNTGSTGDLLFFSPTPGYAVDYYRNWFIDQDRSHPADVVVLGNEWFQVQKVNFDKIDTWPWYANYLRTMYVPVIERHFGDSSAPAYRIYLRKGSAVLAKEQANPLR